MNENIYHKLKSNRPFKVSGPSSPKANGLFNLINSSYPGVEY
jgi:hypothetical protein